MKKYYPNNKLREVLKERGIPPIHISQEIGKHPSRIFHYMAGRVAIPDTIVKDICFLLEMDKKELFGKPVKTRTLFKSELCKK